MIEVVKVFVVVVATGEQLPLGLLIVVVGTAVVALREPPLKEVVFVMGYADGVGLGGA